MRVQGKVGVTGDGEAFNGECVEVLARLYQRRWCAVAANFGKTVRDVENEHNQRPVGWAFDFKVAEERVGAE